MIKFFYSILFKTFLWSSLKEKTRAEFSRVASAIHASLTLISYTQQSYESLISFIYRRGELLLQSRGTTGEQCRDKLKIDPFSSLVFNEKIARK